MSMRQTCLLAIVLFVAACAQRPADTAADQQAIRALSAKWLEAAQRRDPAAEAALFAEDGRTLYSGEEPVIGRAAIEKAVAAEQAANPKGMVQWSTDAVEVASSGDLAVEFGTSSTLNAGLDGAGEVHERYATVYRKRNGQWQVLVDTTSPLPFVAPAADSAAESGLRARIASVEAAWNARDAAGLVAMYSPEGVSVIGAAPRYSGREQNRQMYTSLFDGLPANCRIGFAVTAARFLQPTVGLVETQASFTGCARDFTPDRGLWVLERSAGAWSIASLLVGAAESAGR